MESKDNGNFLLGLTAGVLAGATGFFLTKTSEGKEIKEKIIKEWESVKKKLEDDGVITGNEPSLTQIISRVREKVFSFLDEEVPKKKRGRRKLTTKSTKRGRKKKPKAKDGKKGLKTVAKRKKMFKGI